MENKEQERIFNRQYERMKAELLAINMPQGYLTIISKYWDFLREDTERILDNAIQNNPKDSNW